MWTVQWYAPIFLIYTIPIGPLVFTLAALVKADSYLVDRHMLPGVICVNTNLSVITWRNKMLYLYDITPLTPSSHLAMIAAINLVTYRLVECRS
jgi:hypothetical protein